MPHYNGFLSKNAKYMLCYFMHFEKYDHLDIIKTSSELEEFSHHLLKEEDSGFITIDTEFMRRTTYWSQLCLIQVAGSKKIAIIDPLADSFDLSPFYEVLRAPHLLKVFHAARQDLEILYHLMGEVPHPLFDTQVAGMVCGYGDSVGYSNLVEDILSLRVDKSQRFTDWSIRPLKQKQLKYAIQDVTHLRQIYEKLVHDLNKQGRGRWIDQEMAILTDPKTYQVELMEVWKKIKIRESSPRFLARMQYLAAAREEFAIQKDQPRIRIAGDPDLMLLASDPPETLEELKKLKTLQLNREVAKRFIEVLKEAEEVPLEKCPRKERQKVKAKHAVLIDVLKLWLRHVALEHKTAPKLIASSEELEKLVSGQDKDSPLLRGWRFKVFGRDALSIIKGQKGLKVEGSKLSLIDLASPE